MADLATVMAKLSGIRKAVIAVMGENVSRGRSAGEVLTRRSFAVKDVGHYFVQSSALLEQLRQLLPALYGDFQPVVTIPELQTVSEQKGGEATFLYSSRLLRNTPSAAR
jgi:hypothetical protein